MSKINSTINAINAKRLNNEKKLLEKPENHKHYATAYQDESDPSVWYILIIGDPDIDMYAGGEYIFKIKHAADYPKNPPDYWCLTPSGRFQPDHKICMTNSSYHKESWSPSWNILTIIDGINSIWYQDDTSGIAHITSGRKDSVPSDMRQNRMKLAKQSIDYNKTRLNSIYSKFDRSKLKEWPAKKKTN